MAFQYPIDCVPATSRHEFDPVHGWCVKCGRVRDDGRTVLVGGTVISPGTKTNETTPLFDIEQETTA